MSSGEADSTPTVPTSTPRPAASARSRARDNSSVRLPSRRSSPAGLPVVSGAPKAPSTSSRNWKAIPSGTPTAAHASTAIASNPASAAPKASGPSAVYDAVLARIVAKMACQQMLTAAIGGLPGDVAMAVGQRFGSMASLCTAGQYLDIRLAAQPLQALGGQTEAIFATCLLYTSPSP